MHSPMFYKPNIGKRILIAALITILALAVIFGAVYFARTFAGRTEREVPFSSEPKISPVNFSLDAGIHYQNMTGDSCLYFYSAENVKIANNKGDLMEELSLKLSSPILTVKGNFALFYDKNGKNAVLFNAAKEVNSITLEEKIMLASVNKNGYMLFVTEGALHKCSVSVYTPDGNEIFKWNSGGLSVIAADIADNSKEITVSTINTDGATIQSNLIMFNISKEKPFTNDVYENELFSVVKYSGGYTYCIGSGKTCIYNGYGKLVGEIDYAERELLRYALEEDLLVFAFSGSSAASGAMEIKSYNHKGDEIGSFTSDWELDFLDCKNGNIAINQGRTLSILNSRCREKFQLNINFDMRSFAFFGDHRHGVGITATGAELITLGL